MKVLQVVERYVDPAQSGAAPAWLHHAQKSAVAHPHLLLQGDAVRYAVRCGEDAAASTAPLRVASELTLLIELGVSIYLVSDDASERGIASTALTSHVRLIARADVPRLYAEHDQVWLW